MTKVSTVFTVTTIEGKKKVEVEKTVTRKFRQTTLWQGLEVEKQGQVGDGDVAANGLDGGEVVGHGHGHGDGDVASIHSTSGENSPQERDPSGSKEYELQGGVGSEVLIGIFVVASRGDREWLEKCPEDT